MDEVKRLVEHETYNGLNGPAFALRLENTLSTSPPLEKIKRDVAALEESKADKAKLRALEETLEESIKRATRNTQSDIERLERSVTTAREEIVGVRRLFVGVADCHSYARRSSRPSSSRVTPRCLCANTPRVRLSLVITRG